MNRVLQVAVLPALIKQCSSRIITENRLFFPLQLQISRLMSSSTDDSVANYLKKYEITVDGSDTPPVLSFQEASLPENILNFVVKKFDAPTPIQAQALPIVMEGKNMVGIGQTGSGKTLAFLLPALTKIDQMKSSSNSRNRNFGGPTALVLTPTRELAQQIEEVALEYRRTCGVRTVKCIGGESRYKQLSQYDRQPNLMVATPGRLNDFLQSEEMDINNVEYVVLDEADRMLDMGFEPQIRAILDRTEESKQVLMFSATWPTEVKSLAEDFLGDYTFLNIGSIDLSANKNIKQEIVFCDSKDRMQTFIDKIFSIKDSKMLIFSETKKNVDFLERMLNKRGISAIGIHGDKSQMARSTVIEKFKRGRANIMIATDIAARGLDITDVEYVINYDFPKDIENYIHRIGRTGRAEKTGTAITFFTEEDASYAKKLMKIMKDSNQEIPEDLHRLVKLNVQENQHKRFVQRRERNDFYSNPRGNYNNRNNSYSNYRQRKPAYNNRGSRMNQDDNEYQDSYSGGNRNRRYDDEDDGGYYNKNKKDYW